MIVRNAELKDMKQLGHIMARSFRAAFSEFVTPQTLEACAREENCAAMLEGIFRQGRMHFLIGDQSGFLTWQEAGNGAEIVAIHSLPESWGTGLGAAMLTKAREQIGDRPVFLWAFQENLRARRFYEKQGFRWDGAQRISKFDGAMEVRYVADPETLKIQQAEAMDLQRLAELACKLWPSHTAEEMQAEIENIFAKPDAAFFLVCAENVAIGFAQCQLRHDYVEGTDSSPVGYLEGIYVAEEYRKHGIARELLSACETWAKSKGCTEFASDCELDNVQSLQFHLNMGFEEANRIICFTKKL